ncbi:MAG: D-alanyl-D-alanine carboxypeptidase, partial [Clostridia bacterium]|nr:D-alanyl-D-alanine carboxypeptidase [Clostridia bacterium]
EKYTLKELLLGLLLVSGNDAAEALAIHTGGCEDNFVRMMNKRAKELGMNNTSFSNPHGLDSDKHFSTASDMAKLMCCCMENETFRELCGTKSAAVHGENLVNHNRLLWKYNSCVAGKTGYTMSAGRCHVSASEKDGTRLVCVTLHDSDDWNDHIKLYNWGFSNYSTRNLLESVEYELPLISNSCDTARILPADELNYFLPNNKNVKYTVELPAFVFPPVKIGETAGRIWVIIDNEIVGGCELVYAESIE